MSFRIFSVFSFIRLSVFGFILRPLIHLDKTSVQGYTYKSLCILLHEDFQFDWHHLSKVLSLFQCVFQFFVFFFEKSGIHGCKKLSLVIQFVFIDQLICQSCQYHVILLLQLYSTIWNLEWWDFQLFFCCSGLFKVFFIFYMEMRIVLSKFAKNCVVILMRDWI